MQLNEILEKAQGNRSLNQYAKDAGVSGAMLSLLKTGARRPSPAVLKKLANAAQNGITYKDLMTAAGFWQEQEEDWTLENIKSVVRRVLPVVDDSQNASKDQTISPKQASMIDANLSVVAKDQAMQKSKIDLGDVVLVNTNAKPQNGQIVVADMQSQLVIRRYFHMGTQILLTADSADVLPLAFSTTAPPNILGVATGVVSKL